MDKQDTVPWERQNVLPKKKDIGRERILVFKEWKQQITSEKCNPFLNFTAKEIISATNNFRKGKIVVEHAFLYRGCFENRSILVEMKNEKFNDGKYRDQFIQGLAIAVQVSHHRNALKLLGICLEFDCPAAVYEDSGDLKYLPDLLFQSVNSRATVPFPWSSRLRIAKDIANILVYLHTAFPTPLIYQDMKPRWIFIDQGGVTKLYNFCYSIALPLGKPEITDDITGTIGYLAPDKFQTQIVNTKCDVYSFGVVLLTLLSGYRVSDSRIPESNSPTLLSYMKERICEQGHLQDIVDERILIGGSELEEREQVQAFWNLALKCTQENGIDRPEMIDVAKNLKVLKI